MALNELRKKVIYQNTVDVWVALGEEKSIDWHEPENYKKFIAYLTKNNFNMKKFPLCIKESGGMYERGLEKTKLAETLSESEDPNAAAYTIKLNDNAMELILKFEM
jgi:hypothetical protein